MLWGKDSWPFITGVRRREVAGWFVVISGRVAGRSNACTDDDRRQLIMMIEERVATRSRAGCSTRATVLLPWRLGRTHAANGVLTECVVRPSQAMGWKEKD